MRASHVAETLLLRGAAAVLGTLPRPAALACGAALGSALGALGLRARVARDNLAHAFPERDPAWRAHVLRAHYRELGRVAADYARMPRLVHGPRERAFASWVGEEHAHAARALGRGVVYLTGHLGHFELMGAAIGRLMPVAMLVKPLSNPGADAWLSALRIASGVELLPTGAGVRGAVRRLRAGGCVALLGDQDARRDGVFVPFLGRMASTPAGPAWLSLATGAPIVFGTCLRAPDGRYDARIFPPLMPEGEAGDPAAVRALTTRHTELLEREVRAHPESWFWLHKRWKTSPPAGEA
jgi:KDO2-lipid IV(A) lauroyltransferase